MSEQRVSEKAVSATLRRLDVEADGSDHFIGQTGQQMGPPRLFGGLVAGQAVVAAARTVPGLQPHSLHAYFLQPGAPGIPIEYTVERLKEGKNFHARSVVGRQQQRTIFSLQASFQRPEPGIAHHDPMPEAPAPDDTPGSGRGFGFGRMGSPLQMRDCDGDLERSAERGDRRMWIKPAAALPEDPVLHLGLLVFASDMSLVMTGTLPHAGLRGRHYGGASLDHAMWFHQLLPFDDWTLYTMRTPAAHGGRPLIEGTMYRRDGTRIVTVMQEGLIRTRRPRS